ncbi:MAG: hypothetical protein WD766_05895 [Gemmatimonadota bacterium]
MSHELTARLTPDRRTATWNPALTRSVHVIVAVRLPDGGLEERRSMNSGRVRVRDGERIERIRPAVE